MNTDTQVDLKYGEATKLLLAEETKRIPGCSFDVLNEVGHGLHEKIDENGLCVAFTLAEIPFEQQCQYPVFFRRHVVGTFVPDVVVFKSVIVDAKVIDRITDHERGQMLNYRRITNLRGGLILNFKHAHLQWERLVR
jgi:GxxExxY protein